jgi:hypothetical protein
MRITTRVKVLIASGLSLVAIVAMVGAAFAFSGNAHAAAGGRNPHVLSRNFLATHHSKAGYGTLPKQATAKVNRSKVGLNGSKSANCIAGINGVTNFCTNFTENGFDAFGHPNSSWTTNFLGNAPQNGGVTTIGAPVIPVTVQLLNADGTVAFTIDPNKDVQPTLNSPVFSNSTYDSSPRPTQFADAVQRAEFHGVETNNWHTQVAPALKPGVTMQVPSGKWFVGQNSDGSVAFTLVDANFFSNALFPAGGVPVDNSTIIGHEELNHTMTTKNITTFLFDNVYLFFNGDPNQCCVLGFHGPDVEPGPNGTLNNFDMIYASWMTPGLFLGGGGDITALSHEMSETYGDPFGGAYFPFAYVPWWFSGPDPSFTQCQPLMEDGDVVEVYTVLRSDVVPITINGMTYHPQTEALLQWFEGQTPSTAVDGAYSYPDETILTSAAVSQQPGCTGPA